MEQTVRLEDLSAEQQEKLVVLMEQKKEEERLAREAGRTAYESLKKDKVISMVQEAMNLEGKIKAFNEESFADADTLYELLLVHGNRRAGDKGNYTLTEGDFRITVSKQEQGYFDERSKIAEAHLIDFVLEEFKDRPKEQRLVMGLLERKKGRLDRDAIQRLYKMEDEYDSFHWCEGIRLLKESWTPSESKTYIRFFNKQGKNRSWRLVNLNFSSTVMVNEEAEAESEQIDDSPVLTA